MALSAVQSMRQHYVHVIALTGFVVFVFLWKTHFLSGLYAVGVDEENDAFEPQNLEREPVRGQRHILFVETRCALKPNGAEGSGLLLTNRQACAIESAAKMNPDATVYVLFTCPMNGGMTASPLYVKELFRYPNVKIWKLDLPTFLEGTSLQDWDFKGHVEQSKWPVEHSSYVLRYVSLLKYGGTYLDLDIILMK
jgi:lactosylceramide 4-alpha-galactosyltransferase